MREDVERVFRAVEGQTDGSGMPLWATPHRVGPSLVHPRRRRRGSTEHESHVAGNWSRRMRVEVFLISRSTSATRRDPVAPASPGPSCPLRRAYPERVWAWLERMYWAGVDVGGLGLRAGPARGAVSPHTVALEVAIDVALLQDGRAPCRGWPAGPHAGWRKAQRNAIVVNSGGRARRWFNGRMYQDGWVAYTQPGVWRVHWQCRRVHGTEYMRFHRKLRLRN